MKIQETVRDDGLRIISCRVPSKKTHLELVAGVGSAYDPPGKKGLFHYFEHMAFKGTARRSIADINSFIRRNLLERNAHTGHIEIGFEGEAIARKFPLLCDLMCDIYCNSRFPVEEVEREKEVVLNEIARDHDEDNYLAYIALWKELWRENPLRIHGVGSPSGVQNVTREDLLREKAKWFVPKNTIALAIGDVRHDQVLSLLEKHLALPRGHVLHNAWNDEYGVLPEKQEVVIERPKSEKATLLFGCKFPIFKNERTRQMSTFLMRLLVSGQTSRLWNEVREKRGFAYALWGGISGAHPLGYYFAAYVETLSSRIDTVRELIESSVFTPLQDQSTFEEVQESLDDLHMLTPEKLEDWSGHILGTAQKHWPLKSLERYFPRQRKIISSITLEEVEALRAQTLKPEKFVTVIVKPS
ncbi:MAG: pitrilysin family protein [bacterium]|nr:pitrilysin family protein [bacterium]